MCLTSSGEAANVVSQSISTSLAINVVGRTRSTLALQGINVGTILNPQIELTAISNYDTTIGNNPMRYRYYRKIVVAECGNVTCPSIALDNSMV